MKIELLELTTPAEVESYSPFCLKIHRALKVAGLPYTCRHGGRGPGSFRAYNPAAQVPVLLIDGEVIADSTRIFHRITELAPNAFDTSAEAWLWEDFADTALNNYLVAARWFDERNWPRVRQAYFGAMPAPLRALLVPRGRKRVLAALLGRDATRQGAAALWERFENTLDQLEARTPTYGYWVSDKISVADIAIFAQLHSLRLPLTPPQHEALNKRPKLIAYLDRIEMGTVFSREVCHIPKIQNVSENRIQL